MRARMHACARTHTHTHTHTHKPGSEHTCVHACMHVHTHAHTLSLSLCWQRASQQGPSCPQGAYSLLGGADMKYVRMCCHFSHVQLCDPMDCSPPGSSVHGILQARILECVAIPFSRGSSRPRDRTLVSCISCIGKWILCH